MNCLLFHAIVYLLRTSASYVLSITFFIPPPGKIYLEKPTVHVMDDAPQPLQLEIERPDQIETIEMLCDSHGNGSWIFVIAEFIFYTHH